MVLFVTGLISASCGRLEDTLKSSMNYTSNKVEKCMSVQNGVVKNGYQNGLAIQNGPVNDLMNGSFYSTANGVHV